MTPLTRPRDAQKGQKKQASPGEKLLHNMFRLLQVVKIHQANNKLFTDNVELFRSVLEELWANYSVASFSLHRGRFYLNDERIVYTPTMWTTSAKMTEYFQARGINGVKFYDKGKLSQKDIVGFMDVFNRATKAEDPFEWLDENVKASFPWVEVSRDEDTTIYVDGEAGGEGPTGRNALFKSQGAQSNALAARRCYSQTLTALRTLIERLEAGKSAGVQKTKRAIESLIDLLNEDEASFLALSTIRDAGDQLYTHSVNTAILSLSVGKRLGLTRGSLEQLGLAGLFIDLGKAGEIRNVLDKPEKLTGADLEAARNHSLLSVLSIIRLNASHALKHSILAPAGEHHMGLDHSGYPKPDLDGEGEPPPLSLFGRILAAADQYDALTSVRPWRGPYDPHSALRLLLRDAGLKLDPVILKVLVDVLGSHPPGSVLVLDTHEVAMARHTPSSAVGARPVAVLMNAGEDGTFSPGEEVDLSQKDPATGLFVRSIVKTLPAALLDVQPVDFLLPEPESVSRRAAI
ncbi:MAG: hypothetical protein LBR53_03285 [Deltaproteobacteria bacterium]|jgi:HD-GYP domain-containing protein (c-di-GMP phosphodiesterase class II)|nr:hypothetical protein [Deltaproteobacteria bacterium]